eukprot:1186422-Prorocentrum_minimum.AAC.1
MIHFNIIISFDSFKTLLFICSYLAAVEADPLSVHPGPAVEDPLPASVQHGHHHLLQVPLVVALREANAHRVNAPKVLLAADDEGVHFARLEVPPALVQHRGPLLRVAHQRHLHLGVGPRKHLGPRVSGELVPVDSRALVHL